jgi:hypothetical protein
MVRKLADKNHRRRLVFVRHAGGKRHRHFLLTKSDRRAPSTKERAPGAPSSPPPVTERDGEQVRVEILLGIVRVACLKPVVEAELDVLGEGSLIEDIERPPPVEPGHTRAVNFNLPRIESRRLAQVEGQQIPVFPQQRRRELRVIGPAHVTVLRVLRAVFIVAIKNLPAAAAP